MSSCRGRTLVLGLLVALSAVMFIYSSLVVVAEDLDSIVGPLVRDLGELRRSRVDVSGLASSLDEAVRLWESGDVDGALRVVESVRVEVERLKAEAPAVYMFHTARTVLTVLALLAAPAAFYTLFPRLYLMLWFRFRRGWIVVVKGASRR